MSYEVRRKVIAAATAGAIGTALLSAEGCSAFQSDTSHHHRRQPALARCYDKPQPPHHRPRAHEPKVPHWRPNESYQHFHKEWKRYTKAERRWEQSFDPYSLPLIRIPFRRPGFVQGDPIYTEPLRAEAKIRHTTHSIVEVSAPKWKGSGFLTKDSKGNQVVVTAAHVVGTAALSKLTIETNNGRKVHPTGGCYMFEDNGKFIRLTDPGASGRTPPDTDIAVLTLPHRLGHRDLAISKRGVKRGEWTYFVNYQETSKPGYPASYTGIVAATPASAIGYHIITGIERIPTPVTRAEIDQSEVRPGASGGPIVDAASGAVVGISTSGNKTGYYDDRLSLREEYGISFPGADYGLAHGFIPDAAGAMSTHLIEEALHARRG